MFRRDFVTSLAAGILSIFGRSEQRTVVFGKGKPYEKRLRIVSAKADELQERLKQEEAEALRKAQAEVRAIRWVPVSERIPTEPFSPVDKVTRTVLTFGTYGIRLSEFYVDRSNDGWMKLGGITHWAELPAPPSEVPA